MVHQDPEGLLTEARGCYQLLFDETVCLLKNFDTDNVEEYESAISRRQNLLDHIHEVEESLAELNSCQRGTVDSGLDVDMQEYRAFREESIRKVQEIDAVIISLAREQMGSIKNDLSSLAKGKVVVNAYDGHPTTKRNGLDQTV